VLKFLVLKLLAYVVAYVKYIGPLEAHMRLSRWVVFSLVAFCAVCLVLECILEQDTQHKTQRFLGYHGTVLLPFV
jgi:hypothetical protein